MIKKILFLVTFLTSILFFSTNVNAEDKKDKDIYWQIGDAVLTIMVCRTEKDILEIGYADSQSALTLNQLIQIKIMQNSCLVFNPPLQLEVAKIVGDYKDYNGNNTTMVGVSPIQEPDNILGYLIILGKPLTI
jgi:hypothetical protein|tara:strand:- start:3461 stop:3859 length:399 start_codon:yes stop_codon:yes gene_type:complete